MKGIKGINDYFQFTDSKTKSEILRLAEKLKNKHIVMVNSTPAGGGVSEILKRLVFLLNDLGIKTGWRVLKGSDDFFQVTKEFHNALQGEKYKLSSRKKELYENTNYINSRSMHINEYDLIIIHDPQPLALIKFYQKRNPWLLRLHVDLSAPDKTLLRYLKPFIERYDGLILSSLKYRQPSLKIRQHIIYPSIDPLIEKNVPKKKSELIKILKKQGIILKKPIISQISRFDKWKDPIGVIKVFKEIKKKIDCQLVLLGNLSIDDPEATEILKEIRRRANHDPDIKILLNVKDNDRVVNALQTLSHIVLQKSLKEGFALTVSEAMWKGTAVVGTNVGGIPLQIKNGKTGFLVNNNQECVTVCLKLLKNKNIREKIGREAKKRVKEKFLITRHILDYLKLFYFYLK